MTVQLVDEISTSMGRLETYTDLETEELFNRCFETVPEVPNEGTDFIRMWRQIVDRPCRLYDLPSGRIGKQYVMLLQQELESFITTNVSSERMLILPCLILHRDSKVKAACEAKKLIETRLQSWRDDNFKLLMQSFTRCTSRSNNKKMQSEKGKDEKEKRFAKMIQHGNVRGAVSYLTTKDSKPLGPNDMVETEPGKNGKNVLTYSAENILKQLLYTEGQWMLMIYLKKST